jgi:short-subunit dehydrogenase
MKPPRTALITGATAGIGRSYAEHLASLGTHVVLVARDQQRLEQLATRLAAQTTTEVLVADLANRSDLERVAQRAAHSDVDFVVNNAGFGLNTPFLSGRSDAEHALIDVLVTAVMAVTHAALPGMVARGSGGVITVSSVAGWMTSGTYSAAKAWATTFSESMYLQTKGTGVHVMALCPGYIRTEFHARANMATDSIPRWMWLDVDQLVAQSLRDFERGKPVSVPSAKYRLLALLAQYLPRPLVRQLSTVTRRR